MQPLNYNDTNVKNLVYQRDLRRFLTLAPAPAVVLARAFSKDLATARPAVHSSEPSTLYCSQLRNTSRTSSANASASAYLPRAAPR